MQICSKLQIVALALLLGLLELSQASDLLGNWLEEAPRPAWRLGRVRAYKLTSCNKCSSPNECQVLGE